MSFPLDVVRNRSRALVSFIRFFVRIFFPKNSLFRVLGQLRRFFFLLLRRLDYNETKECACSRSQRRGGFLLVLLLLLFLLLLLDLDSSLLLLLRFPDEANPLTTRTRTRTHTTTPEDETEERD